MNILKNRDAKAKDNIVFQLDGKTLQLLIN